MAEHKIAPPPRHIAELALSCVEYVRRSVEATLDWTPDTLPFVDAWLQQSRGEKRPELMQLVAPTAGAYFGEVLRRVYPARWVAPEGAPATWRLEFEGCFLYFNPVGMAVEAMQHEDTEGLGATIAIADDLVDDLRERLEATAPVRIEDYYRLTTRYEVIDQIVSFLLTLDSDRRADDTSAEAYEAHVSKDAPADA